MGRVALSLFSMFLAGCLLDLDGEPTCGDGVVDRAAGEECDPENEASYANKCESPQGVAACDPNWCALDLRSCSTNCGNARLDAGEECDPTAPSALGEDVFGAGIACSTLDGGSLYTKGVTYTCGSDCRWDRSPCNRCGDGVIQPEEVCEPGQENVTVADAYCMGVCIELHEDPRPEQVRCDAMCNDTCTGYTLVDPEDAGCCIPAGEPVHPRLSCCGFEENGWCTLGLRE